MMNTDLPKIIRVEKNKKPLAFLDTFVWKKIYKGELKYLKKKLETGCQKGQIKLIISNLQKQELIKHISFDENKICKNGIILMPIGKIALNQAISAMVSYYENLEKINLTFDINLEADPPLFNAPSDKSFLRHLVSFLAYKLNEHKKELSKSKNIDELASIFLLIEKEVYKNILGQYWQILGGDPAAFEKFLSSRYFSLLPSVVIRSYLFAHTIRSKEISEQDIVDIYNISEFLPYTQLSIIDKAQYDRLLFLKRHYPIVFKNLFDSVCIASNHKHCEFEPCKTLESFLNCYVT